MSRKKKSLIVFTIGWIAYVVASILAGLTSVNATLASVGSYVTLGAFIVEIVGLALLARDSKNFKWALWAIIIQLILTIVIVGLGVAAAMKLAENENADVTGLTRAISIMTRVTTVVDIFVTCSIVEGCAEVSPRVKGMSHFIEWSICGAIILELILTIISDKIDATAAGILAIVAVVITIIYQLLIVVILLRSIPLVDKPRDGEVVHEEPKAE